MAAHSQHNLSIIDAVETLSGIADLEFDQEVGIAEKHEVVLGNERVSYRTVHWLHEEDAPSTIHLVRETFRVILHYLKQFYKNDYPQVTDQKTLEGIKTLMVLVGEAARKLDKYTKLFHQTQSIADTKEYKQLQELYRTKISPSEEEGADRQWLLGLTLGKGKEGREIAFKEFFKKSETAETLKESNRLFIDLEMLKKDTEYELFLIRKEDGSRFFNPSLLRNIKLVCDFEGYFGERKELDPLEEVKFWRDRVYQASAKDILKALGSRLNHFFQEARQMKDHELVKMVQKTVLALLMSSHQQNLMRHHPSKCCTEYFQDFQQFLREALHSKFYQKWIAYPPKEGNHLAADLLDIIHTLCRGLFVHFKGSGEILSPIMQELFEEAKTLVSREQIQEIEHAKRIMNRVNAENGAFVKLLKHHPNGPLFKAMEFLEGESIQAFDSLMQGNLPNSLFSLHTKEKSFNFIRIAAPIYQEFINKGLVQEEFRGFLRSYSQRAMPRKHLLINLQDRSSWREYFRCKVLEELQEQPEFIHAIEVATLAIDTDFYHQLAPYHLVNHAHQFKEQFKDMLLDESSGYFFSSRINRKELSDFIDGAFEAIHHLFFSSKNVLHRENRLDFIEIFYLFLELKLIEWTQPDTVSLTCKDGIDIGEEHAAGIFLLLKLINQQEMTDADWQQLNLILYAPAILIRERLIMPERFHRMHSAMRVVENACREFGKENFAKLAKAELFPLYSSSILKG